LLDYSTSCLLCFTVNVYYIPSSTMYHHLTTLLLAVLTFVSSLGVFAQTPTTLSYDNSYDNPNLPLSSVACSTGPKGLAQKYPNLGSLPNFPNVGGVYTVEQWGSDQCGSCYAVYDETTNMTVYILAVDVSKTGFTSSQEAMDKLTGNEAVDLGRVSVTYTAVDASMCGL